MEDQMRAIQAVANATAEQMRGLSEKALALGRDTSFAATEAAEGIAALHRAGLTTEEVMAGAVAAVLKEAHMPEIIIRRPSDGREYAIQSGDFRRGKHHRNAKTGEMETYESAGFEIVSKGDGSEYTPPAERSQGEHAP